MMCHEGVWSFYKTLNKEKGLLIAISSLGIFSIAGDRYLGVEYYQEYGR
jgi:hypothetical protein